MGSYIYKPLLILIMGHLPARLVASAIVFLITISIAYNSYFNSFEPQIIHFKSEILREKNGTMSLVGIWGQYKTSKGFFVGEEIEICAVFQPDSEGFEFLKNVEKDNKPLFLSFMDTEDPDNMYKDSCVDGNMKSVKDFHTNRGYLTGKINDTDRTIRLYGKVIVTREGKLVMNKSMISSPIGYALNQYGLELTNIYITPYSEKYQMEASRIMISLTWITAGLALIAIIIASNNTPLYQSTTKKAKKKKSQKDESNPPSDSHQD